MNDRESDVVQVKIYDREYALRTTGDAERLHQVCRSLDRRMREVAKSSGSVDTLKVAVLAALNVEDELLRLREELRRIDESLSRRSLECVTMLDRLLP